MAKSMKTVENEVFALRNGERYGIQLQQPDSGRWFAVQARSCFLPTGPAQPVRESDGATVESAAIVAAQVRDGKWQWMHLSAPTKEFIGDLLFDSGASKDQWYFVTVQQA